MKTVRVPFVDDRDKPRYVNNKFVGRNEAGVGYKVDVDLLDDVHKIVCKAEFLGKKAKYDRKTGGWHI